MGRGAVRGLACEVDLLHARTAEVDLPRFLVADGAAHDCVSLVRVDDLQLARLAADHLRRRDLGKERAVGKMPRAPEADLFAKGTEQPERPATFASLQTPRCFRLAEGIELHVGYAEPEEHAIALGQ